MRTRKRKGLAFSISRTELKPMHWKCRLFMTVLPRVMMVVSW